MSRITELMHQWRRNTDESMWTCETLTKVFSLKNMSSMTQKTWRSHEVYFLPVNTAHVVSSCLSFLKMLIKWSVLFFVLLWSFFFLSSKLESFGDWLELSNCGSFNILSRKHSDRLITLARNDCVPDSTTSLYWINFIWTLSFSESGQSKGRFSWMAY